MLAGNLGSRRQVWGTHLRLSYRFFDTPTVKQIDAGGVFDPPERLAESPEDLVGRIHLYTPVLHSVPPNGLGAGISSMIWRLTCPIHHVRH